MKMSVLIVLAALVVSAMASTYTEKQDATAGLVYNGVPEHLDNDLINNGKN